MSGRESVVTCWLTEVTQSSLGTASGGSQCHTKVIYLVRHAEATHNVEEQRVVECARLAGKGPEECESARRAALWDDQTLIDAPLSHSGIAQVEVSAERLRVLLAETHYGAPGLVLVSPLRRTLQTATKLFGPGSPCSRLSSAPSCPRIVAIESLREKRTGMACDERHSLAELRQEFPLVDFWDVEHTDLQVALGEDNAAVRQRAIRFLSEYLPQCSATTIAIVSHKGWLRELRAGLKQIADERGDLRLDFDLDLERVKVLGNAEVRVAEFTWCKDELRSIVSRSLTHAIEAPPMVVTRADIAWASLPRLVGHLPVQRLPCIAMAASTISDPVLAAEEAWSTILSSQPDLSEAPLLVIAFGIGDTDAAVLASSLRAKLPPNAALVGCSSAGGLIVNSSVNSSQEIPRLGLLCLRCAQKCGIAAADKASLDPKITAASATRQALASLEDLVADLLVVFGPPDVEEAALAGVRSVCSDVAVWGCSAADESADRDRALHSGGWWQICGDVAMTDAIVVAALVLPNATRCANTFSRFYAPTVFSGRATSAEGHLLSSINGRTAVEVLDEWSGGAIEAARTHSSGCAAVSPINVIKEFALLPLAFSDPCLRRIVHVRTAHADGSVECFGDVCQGRLRMLSTRRADLPSAIAAAAGDALDRAHFVVEAAVVALCAGAASISDRNNISGALKRAIPNLDFMIVFAFGEIGMLDGRAARGGGMIHIALFGQQVPCRKSRN